MQVTSYKTREIFYFGRLIASFKLQVLTNKSNKSILLNLSQSSKGWASLS